MLLVESMDSLGVHGQCVSQWGRLWSTELSWRERQSVLVIHMYWCRWKSISCWMPPSNSVSRAALSWERCPTGSVVRRSQTHTFCATTAWPETALSSALPVYTGLSRSHSGKESTCQSRRHGFHPWVRKIPWRRKRQLTSVFLPGKFHGQSSLVGYSPWGRKELDTIQWLSMSTRYLCISLNPYNLTDTSVLLLLPFNR